MYRSAAEFSHPLPARCRETNRASISTTIPIEVEGAIVGIYGVAKDVTEEVHAGSERSSRASDSNVTWRRLNSAILNSLPAHIALLDHAGNVVAVNEAWRTSGTHNSFDDPSVCGGPELSRSLSQRGLALAQRIPARGRCTDPHSAWRAGQLFDRICRAGSK